MLHREILYPSGFGLPKGTYESKHVMSSSCVIRRLLIQTETVGSSALECWRGGMSWIAFRCRGEVFTLGHAKMTFALVQG
jgi:hypothetical protein